MGKRQGGGECAKRRFDDFFLIECRHYDEIVLGSLCLSCGAVRLKPCSRNHRRRGYPGRGATLSAEAAARHVAPRRRRTKSAPVRPRLEIFRNELTSSRSRKSSCPHVDLRYES